MDDIVEVSNLSKGSIYNYFTSKKEIFLEIYQEWWKLILKKVDSTLKKDSSAKEQIKELLTFSLGIRSRTEYLNYHNLLNPLFFESKDLKDKVKNIERYNTFHNPFVNIIEKGIKQNDFRSDIDPNVIATIIQAIGLGILSHWADYKVEFDWDHIIKHILKILDDGIFMV